MSNAAVDTARGASPGGRLGERDWLQRLLARPSIEITVKHQDQIGPLRDQFAPGTEVFIAILPKQSLEKSAEAAKALATAGFTPVPHIAARGVESLEALQSFLARATGEAGVDRVLAIAGDIDAPRGPFTSVMDMLETGAIQAAGVERLFLAGHPDRHPVMPLDELDAALAAKVKRAEADGLATTVVTQFCFEAAPFMRLLDRMARHGIASPLRFGLAGPASPKTLATYAMRCGVSASTRVITRQTSLMARLFGNSGPDRLVQQLARALADRPHPPVDGIHMFPFGGVTQTGQWLTRMRARG